MSHITDGMKPGDVKFVEQRQVVCIHAYESRDDFKAANYAYTTLAESEHVLAGSRAVVDAIKAVNK